jgi:3-phosphoshikimate 1-carboxyvinyltransferase
MQEKPVSALKSEQSLNLHGDITVPGDKSISHRAVILGALADGVTQISGLLESDDVLATIGALQALGVPITRSEDDSLRLVTGCGIGGFTQPDTPLDFGNSGTAARLMMGVISGYDMEAVFCGDTSLSSRPMERVITPLKQMGLNIREESRVHLPLTLLGTSDLLPLEYTLPVASAQVKSAILLAGLHARGKTTVTEPVPTRDHTERMLEHFGADIQIEKIPGGGRRITVAGAAKLRGCDILVPGDPSSAAFPVAAAIITEGSDITVRNVLLNPTRSAFYEVLQQMGADIKLTNQRTSGGEQIADIRARESRLHGITVPAKMVPSMIDEYPCLAIVAAFADGVTIMEGLAELRVKESDRLAAAKDGLQACGVKTEINGDALIVHGNNQVAGGCAVKSHMDHRIAMAFAIMGLATQDPITIDSADMIATSFPDFVPLMQGTGAKITL